MAKTPNMSKTHISETLQVSFQTPRAYLGGCNHHRDIRSHPQQLQRNSPARHLQLSLPRTPRRRYFRPSGWSFAQGLHLPGAEAELWSDCRNATKTSFGRSILPGLEMLEKTGTHNMQHGPSHPHNFATIANWFLDPEPKCHETAWFRFTDRQKTSITRMSMPSGLNGKDTTHLKDTNLWDSNYKSLSRPQKFIKVPTTNMLQTRNPVFWSMENAWNISPNTFKSPFRTARVDPKKSFSPQTLSVQATFTHTPKPCATLMAPPDICADEFIMAMLPPDWAKCSET